jgi:hypothetical protein
MKQQQKSTTKDLKHLFVLLLLLLLPNTSLAGGKVLKDTPFSWEYLGSQNIQLLQKEGRWEIQFSDAFFAEKSKSYVQHFRLGLPKGQTPLVHLEVLEEKQLAVNELITYDDKDSSVQQVESVLNYKVIAGAKVLRDGSWVQDFHLPLLRRSASGLKALQKYRLTIKWPRYKSQVASRRFLRKVMNPGGAKFWRSADIPVQKAKPLSKSLAKHSVKNSTAKKTPAGDVQWISRLRIGDNDVDDLSENGVYALSWRDWVELLKPQGLSESDLQGYPIASIHLFSGYRDTLSEHMKDSIPVPGDDLQAIPVRRADHSGLEDESPDFVFNEGDTLYFYATGTAWWKHQQNHYPATEWGDVPYQFSHSPYSNYNFVYVGISDEAYDDEWQVKSWEGGETSLLRSATLRYLRVEEDLLLRDNEFGDLDEESGKEWFWFWKSGDESNSLTLTTAQLDHPYLEYRSDFDENGTVYLQTTFFPHREPKAYHESHDLDSGFEKLDVDLFLNGTELTRGRRSNYNIEWQADLVLQHRNNELKMVINPSGYDERFDGYSLAYLAYISYKPGGLHWLPVDFNRPVEYIPIFVPGNLRILRLSHGRMTEEVNFSDSSFIDSVSVSDEIEYYFFTDEDIKKVEAADYISPTPTAVVKDLKNARLADGSSAEDVEYLIITPRVFVNEALELAEYRNSSDVLRSWNTHVALLEDIYRDYSSGRQSVVAIRDFIRYAYHEWGGQLQAALLVGDGHFDYRNVLHSDREIFFPPYEREDMSSDDFFGILDKGEQLSYNHYDQDVWIGRLPVESGEDIKNYIDKLKLYTNKRLADFGPWRNSLILAADDALQRTSYDRSNHTGQVEEIAQSLDAKANEAGLALDIEKLYLLDYEADANYRKPEARRALIEKINQGALFTVYFGHGSSSVWADERVLEESALSQIDNSDRTTILCSFACTVGRFDLLNASSLSETFVNNAVDGAIASIAATRLSYSRANKALGKALLEYRYFDDPEATLGEVLAKVKYRSTLGYDSQRYNNEKYLLFGEPVLGFNAVQTNLRFTQAPDTLQALQKVVLEGEIPGAENESGKIYLQVFEGSKKRVYDEVFAGNEYYQEVEMRGNRIYAEVLDWENGEFKTEFITPRKISFGDTNAAVFAYSWNEENEKVYSGIVASLPVFGTSSYADSIVDKEAPNLRFQQCGTQDSLTPGFAPGEEIRLDLPACLEVVVEDSTGVDMSEEADEGLIFEVKDKEYPHHPYPLVEQTGRRVVARKQFGEEYLPGEYVFRVQVQDVLGNFVEREERILLEETLENGLGAVYNAPNPVGKKGTKFYFNEFSGDRQNAVTIKIFDQRGYLVQVLHSVESGVTHWDGRDAWGNLLANGLYYYKIVNAVLLEDDENLQERHYTRLQKLLISR